MQDSWLIIIGLALLTFIIRLSGIVLGRRIPQSGPWVRALQALPGSLLIALVTVSVVSGGWLEWLAAAIALGVAIVTNSLPITMLVGIVSIYLLRLFFGGL